MNRRGFLGMLVAAVAGVALNEAIPFGRVWSFPSKIVLPKVVGAVITVRLPPRFLTEEEIWIAYMRPAMMQLVQDIDFTLMANYDPDFAHSSKVRYPQRFIISRPDKLRPVAPELGLSLPV